MFLAKKEVAFVFSFNYFPLVSRYCQEHNLIYASFIYDSPLVALFSCTVINPCNIIFIFDKAMYLRLKNIGIKTVHYLPLCANAKRLTHMKRLEPHQTLVFTSDVAFVGSLYNEKHNFFDKLEGLDDKTKGYLDGIMASQLQVSGYSFIEDLLSEDILNALRECVPYKPLFDGTEPDSYVYTSYFIERKMTSMERIDLLRLISDNFHLNIFTHKECEEIENANFMSAIDYYNQMPYVFLNSKINLNITLRSIHSGIPLRAFDIMGCGGFLLTNFQADFLDYFVPDEDFVYYESREDLLNKIEYYLSHDKERCAIAANGLNKVSRGHSYVDRARYIADMVQNNPVF